MRSRAERGLAAALALLLASCGVPERPSTTTAASRPVADTPVKIGKPYQIAGLWYVPSDDRGYDEVGLASWYGAQFHGAATANGERFDMDRIGAAHKTLPLPCYAEVTALDTGRTILVRINDRGPFVANRIIDLSRASARMLGIEKSGVARVRVRRVEPSERDRAMLREGRAASARPDAQPALLAQLNTRFAARTIVASTPAPIHQPLAIGQYVQVAAFSDRAKADAVAGALANGGDVSVASAGGLWRVRLGPYFSDDGVREALARVQARGYQDAHMVSASADN